MDDKERSQLRKKAAGELAEIIEKDFIANDDVTNVGLMAFAELCRRTLNSASLARKIQLVSKEN